VLGEALRAFMAVLGRHTLADLVHDRDEALRALFAMPPVALKPPLDAEQPELIRGPPLL
jgi:hypothetical protein